MSRLELAAIKVHQIFWNNTGETRDWPIMIKVDDELYDELADALNELGEAVEELCPGSSPWPVKITL